MRIFCLDDVLPMTENDDGIFAFRAGFCGMVHQIFTKERKTNEKLAHEDFVSQKISHFGIPSDLQVPWLITFQCQPRLFTFLLAGEVIVPKSIGAGDSGGTRVGRARAESSLPALLWL